MPEEKTFEDFKAAIPEQFQDMGIVKEADSFDNLFSRVKDLNEHRGNSIRIPSEEAGADAFSEFSAKLAEKVPGLIRIPQPEDESYNDVMGSVFKQLGRPDEASGYKLPEVPEGLSVTNEALVGFAEDAHKIGMSQKQFEAVLDREMTRMQTMQESARVAAGEVEASIKAEWGDAFNTKSALVKGVIEKLFPSLKEMPLTELGLDTAKDFLALAETLNAEGGSTIDLGMKGEPDGKMTPGEAQARISEIRANREHAYHNKADPGHASALKLMRELYEAAHGKAKVGGGTGSEGISFTL